MFNEIDLREKVQENWKALLQAKETRSEALANATFRKLYNADPWEKYYTLKVLKTVDPETYYDAIYLNTEDVKVGKRGLTIAKQIVCDILDHWNAWEAEVNGAEFASLGDFEEFVELYKSLSKV